MPICLDFEKKGRTLKATINKKQRIVSAGKAM